MTTPLAQLEARCGPATFEDGAPTFVRVMVPHGLRHYFGGSLSSALAQALAATTPRAEREET
jgi:hypothetical protein